MISKISTVAFDGIKIKEVEVQVAIANGLPSFNIVGLADKAVSESKERLRSAFATMGVALPAKRITVNLSPADINKEGSHFDLPITLGILGALDIIPKEELINFIAMGEIALDGAITAVNGILAGAYFASSNDKGVIIPRSQINEVYLIKNNTTILAINNLREIIDYFKNDLELELKNDIDPIIDEDNTFVDIANIKGQESAKRALTVAAAGGHNMLMIGPPGSGKSMLANALGGLLPPLNSQEAIDVSLIYSVAGELRNKSFIKQRPYRAPHHSASMPSLIGGGTKAVAGEITLAHNGVLFLDELAEFNRNILDALRQPIENGKVNISRVNYHVEYPAKFQLIAAMNPCRCGYFGEEDKACSKAPLCAENYQNKISGPILDRIDIVIEVLPIKISELNSKSNFEETKIIKDKILKAREIQALRYEKYNIQTNSEVSSNILDEVALITSEAQDLLIKASEKFKFSTRAYYRVIKTARTIADLENSKQIQKQHIAEAINYRKVNYYNKLLEKSY